MQQRLVTLHVQSISPLGPANPMFCVWRPVPFRPTAFQKTRGPCAGESEDRRAGTTAAPASHG